MTQNPTGRNGVMFVLLVAVIALGITGIRDRIALHEPRADLALVVKACAAHDCRPAITRFTQETGRDR